MTDEYTETFAMFILQCKQAYEDLVASIENGDVAAGRGAKVTIDVPPKTIDQIRFERLMIEASNDGRGR